MQGMTGSFQLMKSLNRSLVLNIIRQHGPISRTDISKKASLTHPTVSNIVAELTEEGIVREGQVGESRGGRKPMLLSIYDDHSYVIGVDVGTGQLRVGLTNLRADVKEIRTQKFPEGMQESEFLEMLVRTIRELLESSGIERSKVLGIGVGMHGIVDVEQGVSIYAPHFGYRDIPLVEMLGREFKLPVKMENDARCSAIAERWFGSAQHYDNIVCINVGEGIGAGVIVDGKIFRGRHHIAGELGHMIVDLNGRRCTCGSYGCLHTVASGIHIRERVLHDLTLGRSTMMLKMVDRKEEITGEVIHEAARSGDVFAQEVLAEAGRFLGLACTNLINTMNPDKIIFTGGVMAAGEYVMGPLRHLIRHRALTKEAQQTEVVLSELGPNSAMLGAVTLVLQEIFEVEG
ncbi:ROK family transcriptional regulator [Alkalicoccus luteus]|uniref:ROK family transcriptional regulator n=1 Tax=Alkalicoccus luteus TaxID=1237094 RepID=A0A969PQM0_9BACI|nr:ROK family transcriptional regulator [Alkalicoccus luteus]NJP38621.1 ROK family transcriptional regulator [Alkalicoccus luteus]